MKSTAALLYSVFKLRIGMAISLSALAGLAVTPGPSLPGWKIAVLGLSVLAASAAAGAFNQFAERDLDARMERTRDRPFVTGRFVVGTAWLACIVSLLAVAVTATALALNPVSAVYVLLGAVVYGVVYTLWLKRRTTLNIVIGGLAGSFAVLAGAAAVDPFPGPVPLILAAVLFLWTPPHFWSLATALHEDYERAGVPMLPVVVGDARAAWIILAHTVALVAISLLPLMFGMGWVYGVLAAAGGAWFIYASVLLVRDPGPGKAMKAFFASLVQLGFVLTGALLEGGLLA